MDPKWFCPKCGKEMVILTLDEGKCPSCLDCKIRYTIHGTGVDGSLFVMGADALVIKF